MKFFTAFLLLCWIVNAQVLAQGTMSAFSIYSEPRQVQQNDAVCFPIRVSGFDTILGLQCAFKWDPMVLTFRNTQLYNTNLNNLGCAFFNYTALGQLNFVWDDPTTLGKTLPDSTTLFEVCFTVTGEDGDQTYLTAGPISSNIGAGAITISSQGAEVNKWTATSSIPTEVLISNAVSLRRDIIHFQPDTMTLPLGTLNTNVPIRAFNFKKINAFDFAVEYDSSVLSYNSFTHSMTNPVPPTLSDTVFRVTQEMPGVLRVYWRDYPSVGETLTDSVALLTLNFDVIGADYTYSPIVIGERLDFPVPIPFRAGERFSSCRFRQPTELAGEVRIGPKTSSTQSNDIVNKINILVTPNPFGVSTTAYFEVQEQGVGHVFITDIAGKKIFQKNIDLILGRNGMVIANTDLRVPGMYYLTIITDTGYAVQPIVFN